MSSSQKMIRLLSSDEQLGDMTIVSGGNADILPFPLPCPYVAVSDGQAKGDYLPGTDIPLMNPAAVVKVFVPEADGAAYCRECAGRVCVSVTEGDEDRMITSVSVSPCSFCDEYMAWEYDIVFGLRGEEGFEHN